MTAPDPIAAAGASAPTLVGPGPFAAVRARWLPLVAIGALVILLVAAALLQGLLGLEGEGDELFAALLYLPLLVWTGWIARRHHINLRAFFRRPRIGRYWWVVAGMTLALFVFSIGAANITSALFPDLTSGAAVTTEAGFPVLLVSLVILPPFVEELIFRGMLLERWAVKWRLGVAIVVQAVVFGVLHVDPVGAGMFGVVMALMYIRSRTLWVPIAMHAANNGTVLAFVYLAGDSVADEAAPDLAAAMIAGLVLIGLSLPFIVVFLMRNWPSATTLTPYEAFDHGDLSLPPRHCGRVDVAAGPYGIAGSQGRLWLQPDRLIVNADRRGRRLLTAVPWQAIRVIAVGPDYRTMVLTAADGTSVTLTLPQRSQRARQGITAAVAQRVSAVGGPPAAWLPPLPTER